MAEEESLINSRRPVLFQARNRPSRDEVKTQGRHDASFQTFLVSAIFAISAVILFSRERLLVTEKHLLQRLCRVSPAAFPGSGGSRNSKEGNCNMLLEGCQPFRTEDAMLYVSRRWWTGLTYGDLVDRAADKYPERIAVVDQQTRLTYTQLRETADRLAIALLDLGIKPRDRVLVQLPNWHEFAFAYFGIQKIGAIPVLLIDRYRQYEANHLCSLTQAAAWVVPEALGKVDYRPIVSEVLKNNPQTGHVIMVRAGGTCPYHRLEDLIAGDNRTETNLSRLAACRPDPSDVAHMGPTGGSTGLPKVAPHAHKRSPVQYGVCGSSLGIEPSRHFAGGGPHRSRLDLHQRLHQHLELLRPSGHAGFDDARIHLFCYPRRKSNRSALCADAGLSPGQF